MKKVNKYKILTVILLSIVVICSARLSFAATINNSNTTNSLTSIQTTNGSATNNPVNNIPNNTPVNTPAPSPSPSPVPNNTALPETGAESTTALIVLIVVASISAIYTYSKVKEYNV